MSDIFKAPYQCTQEELGAFYQLLTVGNEVERQSAQQGIDGSKLLAFHYQGKTLAGIAAVKQPLQNYKTSIFQKSKAKEQAKAYDLELGYAVTLEEFRGMGICSYLVSQLVNLCQNNMYATTRTANTTMQKILKNNGFQKLGSPYRGMLRHENEYFLQLFTRET